jgi:proteasome-associated ATPase
LGAPRDNEFMICVGNYAPVGRGVNVIEYCLDHFEPVTNLQAPPPPAFLLHARGLSPEDQTVAFSLVEMATGTQQMFTARWGRTGVGSSNFMPVPKPLEDDLRPRILAYGFPIANFTWRNCQWEVLEVVTPGTFDFPSLTGETIEVPTNLEAAIALRDGRMVANVDVLDFGTAGDIIKERDSGGAYRIRFGGRIWRRMTKGDPALELIAFDPDSAVLQTSLDDVWGEIGGQDEAKRELIRAIQWPVLYPELFRLFKRRRSRGVLLYGPPGCGKTLLGKAVVRLLAALYHRKADDGGFKYVKGHQLLDMYVGQSEKAVKALFDEARRWRETKGYPAVLFFDEADALFKRRPSGSTEQAFTLVPALLAEMDGMDESGAFVMLATNRPEALDQAITRPGRIDRRIRVTRPDESACQVIFRIHLDGVFLAGGVTLADVSAGAAAELFRPDHRLYEVETSEGEKQWFLLQDLSSGALVQNIVDRATANKMESCIETGVTTGLSVADVRQAVAEVLGEHRESRHSEELEEWAERRGVKIRSVRKAG